MTNIEQKYQTQILQFLYDEHKKKSSQTVSDMVLTQHLKEVPWELIRPVLDELEQQKYITVNRQRTGVRILSFFKITTEGIDFLERGSENRYATNKTKNGVIKILFLTANPLHPIGLRLDKESRSIGEALRKTEFRDKFAIEQEWAVRVTDLQGHLLRHRPDIVHFSGHGDETSGGIILEDEFGGPQIVSVKALSTLFSLLPADIRCVLLNACYSKRQAGAIAKHIDCVIGMAKAVSDAAAIDFSTAFYQALGYGENVKTAFDLGCTQIKLQNLNERNRPTLLAKRCDPSTVVFV